MKPGAAQNQDIDASIVVVIGLQNVKAAYDACESCLIRHSRERAIAVVVKILKLVADPHMRNHQVEMAVVVEVLQNDSTGGSKVVDSTCD